jgi:hypothetical protein
MGLFDANFGRTTLPAAPTDSAEDTSERKSSPALIMVFRRVGSYPADDLQRTLLQMSPDLASLTVQIMPGSAQQGTPVIRVAWRMHVIEIVGFNVPLPKAVVDECVQPAHYSQDLKAAIRAHPAHAMLYYSGEAIDPLEQYVALSAVAAAFANHDGIGVLNEAAMTSLPAAVVHTLASKQPNFELLRDMPLLMLFCGFVKYFMPDKSVWMRTYNNPTFNLPDLAAQGTIAEGQSTFDLFTGLMTYLLRSGAKFAPGHTAAFGDQQLRFRAPRNDEPFPTHTAGKLLIVERTNR